jgi:tellurite resistance protein
MNFLQRLEFFPASFFGMIMGLCGLGIALLTAIPNAGELILIKMYLGFVWVLAGLLFVIYGVKVIRYLPAVMAEMRHPIKMNFVPALSISFLLLSVIFWKLHLPQASLVFWSIGAIAHFALTYWVLYHWIHHDHFQIEHSNPAWFIPIVGNIIVPIAGVHHVALDINLLFFATGLVFWLVLKTILMNRIIFHAPMPNRLIPTLFIFIAPPAVGFLSYLAINGGELDLFAKILYLFAAVMTLLMLVSVRKFVKLEFALSWWAFTFPLAAMSIASFKYADLSGVGFYNVVGWIVMSLLSAMIVLFLFKTAQAARKGKICVDH